MKNIDSWHGYLGVSLRMMHIQHHIFFLFVCVVIVVPFLFFWLFNTSFGCREGARLLMLRCECQEFRWFWY